MNPIRRAVVDVGTNSVKLLVGEIVGQEVNPLLEKSVQTRLGRGFYADHRLQPDAIELTARVVAAFVQESAQWQAVSTRVIATSAARDAHNRDELIAAILRLAMVPVEIISGEQEADWAFQGVTTDARLANRPLLIMDVGGGSMQLIYFDGSQPHVRHSFRLGAVRLLEKMHPSDPPSALELTQCRAWLREFIKQQIRPVVEQDWAFGPANQMLLVGTGGSSSLLVTMHLGLTGFERAPIEAASLTRHDIQQRLEQLWSLPLAERKRIPGLHPQKADVILMGAAIHAAMMEAFDLPNLRVSTRGLRFAALINEPQG